MDNRISLTDCLRQIGEEEISICIDGKHLVVSKTEAVARKLFLLAHGGVEETIDETGQIVKVFHKPDFRVAKILREFTEGKAPMEVVETGPKGRKPGSFNSSVSRRLNDRLGPKRPRTSKSNKLSKGNQNV